MAYQKKRVFTFSPTPVCKKFPGFFPHEIEAFVAQLFRILDPRAPLALVLSQFDDLVPEQVARLHHAEWYAWGTFDFDHETLFYRAGDDFIRDAQYLMDFFEPAEFFNIPSIGTQTMQQIAHCRSFDTPSRRSEEFVAAYSPIVVNVCGLIDLLEHIGPRPTP